MALSLCLVEDEQRYREPFERLIGTTDEFRLDSVFERYEELEAYLRSGGSLPDLVVMDLKLPGTSGIEGTRALRRRYPGLPVVALTTLDDPASVFDALRAGASGYVVKGTPPDQMFAALREAHAGGTYFAPSVARHVLGHFAEPEPLEEPLTERERDVLRELAEGRTKAGIAERLFLSPHTVDTHLRNVYTKLHVRTAAEAAAKGVRNGLV